MSQIMNLVLDALVEHVNQYMHDDLPEDDPIRAKVVKKGLLQTGKLENITQIGITGGDHEKPDDLDAIMGMESLPDIGFTIPAREIGGGQIWMRRGVAKLECFYTRPLNNEKLTEDRAHEVAYETLGRLLSVIETAPVRGLVDSYGEKAFEIFCYSNTFFESGGPPNNYIFRGKVLWAILTERP
jgi:hypothetical protein